jgi:hypothetical protein
MRARALRRRLASSVVAFTTGRTRRRLQLVAKASVDSVSACAAREGVTVARIVVQLLPPKDCRSRRVSLELR